ncbi:MAG TPA: 3-phosphoshikimate 1-carboxyvinyltransferase, partial [Anaerolineales bacterium]|nr:3-phosphoshikimate 1-carboxyvinyltransferase [Anaerolineales bacterium]
MNLTVFPGHPLRGTVHLPGDKSLSHRAALFAALAEGESRIENFLNAGVTRAMLNALTMLGIEWEMDGRDTLRISGHGLIGFTAPSHMLDCGNSATTLRLLTGALAGSGRAAALDGTPGLRRRPMHRIVHPLQQMGVPIQATLEGTAPLQLASPSDNHPLRGMRHTLNVASAQVKTCLLLAGLGASEPTETAEPAASRDHSERMLRRMGVSVEQFVMSDKCLTRVTPPENPLEPLQLRLPGDISSAAFFIVAALITPGSEITIPDILLNPGRTGLIEVLQSMGAQIEVQADSNLEWEPCG